MHHYIKATDATAFSPYPQFVEVPEQEALRLLSKDERNVVIDQQRTYPLERLYPRCWDMLAKRQPTS